MVSFGNRHRKVLIGYGEAPISSNLVPLQPYLGLGALFHAIYISGSLYWAAKV